jgi:hypothetical protein
MRSWGTGRLHKRFGREAVLLLERSTRLWRRATQNVQPQDSRYDWGPPGAGQRPKPYDDPDRQRLGEPGESGSSLSPLARAGLVREQDSYAKSCRFGNGVLRVV